MNCKPGDLARVISTPETRDAGVVDWFFKLTVLDGQTDFGNAPAWRYEGPERTTPEGRWKGLRIEAVGDHILRPIRDPGDDAVDETLLRVPSPSEPATC